jgi:hypothetical protein
MYAQDWMELKYLTGRINELECLHRIMLGGDRIRAIEREIEARAAQRQRLVNRLSKNLATRITASAAA